MGYQEIIKKIKPELDEAMASLQEEMGKVRSGRPTASLFSDIKVNCFGQEFRLSQLAVISLVGPKEFTIQPWDGSYMESILGALSKTSFGSSAMAEKNLIRITMPSLSEEYRKNVLKLLSEKIEETRVILRRLRDEAWKEIQEGTRAGEVREDDKFRGKDELDKLIKERNEKIEEMEERKKKEIME